MNQANHTWGDMVIPGVYMIQRTPNSGGVNSITEKDGIVNLELVHLEIDEMEKHIELLRKSNVEIAAYLKEKRENAAEDEEGGEADSMVALSSGAVKEEDEDAVFREALEENVLVIARKENELSQLRELIKGQRCGCGEAHVYHPAAQPEPGSERQTRITL